MASATLERMGTHKQGDEQPTQKASATVRLPADIVRKLNIIASVTGQSVQDILVPLVGGEIDKLYKHAAKTISEEAGGGKK